MPTTRRAWKCIFRYMPNEMLAEICQYVDMDSSVALCRVSKLFYKLAINGVYKSVCVRDPDFLDTPPKKPKDFVSLFARTMSRQAKLARLVKSFHFEGGPESTDNLKIILSRLTNAQEIDICVTELAENEDLSSITNEFPHLRIFRLITRDGPALQGLIPSKVLNKEELASISLLSCDPPPVQVQDPTTSLLSLCFPKLCHFRGHASFLPSILRHSPLLTSLSIVFPSPENNNGYNYTQDDILHLFTLIKNSAALANGNLQFIWIHDYVDLFGLFPKVYDFIPDKILIAKYDYMGKGYPSFNDLMSPARQKAIINALSTKTIGMFSFGKRIPGESVEEWQRPPKDGNAIAFAERCLEASANFKYCMIAFSTGFVLRSKDQDARDEQRTMEIIDDIIKHQCGS